MTNAERARELNSALSAVRTNADARRAAAQAAWAGTASIEKFGGFIGAGAREQIARDVLRVTGAAESIPDDDGVAGEAWTARPGGLRVAIESLTANVWSQERFFPEGTSVRDDFAVFADGAVGAIKDAVTGVVAGIPVIGTALGGLLWPVAAAAVAILVLVVVVKAKA